MDDGACVVGSGIQGAMLATGSQDFAAMRLDDIGKEDLNCLKKWGFKKVGPEVQKVLRQKRLFVGDQANVAQREWVSTDSEDETLRGRIRALLSKHTSSSQRLSPIEIDLEAGGLEQGVKRTLNPAPKGFEVKKKVSLKEAPTSDLGIATVCEILAGEVDKLKQELFQRTKMIEELEEQNNLLAQVHNARLKEKQKKQKNLLAAAEQKLRGELSQLDGSLGAQLKEVLEGVDTNLSQFQSNANSAQSAAQDLIKKIKDNSKRWNWGEAVTIAGIVFWNIWQQWATNGSTQK